MFTINNPQDEDNPESWDMEDKGIRFMVWQKESGENETQHYQGYVLFGLSRRLNFVKTINGRAHWEARRGTHEQAKEYCSKEDTRVDGPWTRGVEPRQGRRTDLSKYKEAMDEGQTEYDIATSDELFPVWAKYHRAGMRYQRLLAGAGRSWLTKTLVLWGPPGTGKTYTAMEMGGRDAYWLPKPAAHGTLWFDGYEGQSCVVIDEFFGWITRDLMCRMCDRYPLMVETKGGHTHFLARQIIITSNKEPKDWWRDGLGAMERRLTGEMGEVRQMQEPFVPRVEAEEEASAELDWMEENMGWTERREREAADWLWEDEDNEDDDSVEWCDL